MKLQVVASGSKANCYILSAGEDKLILDAGVRFPVLQQALDFDYSVVQGCLITHLHEDHMRCMEDVIKAGIEVYASPSTFFHVFEPCAYIGYTHYAGPPLRHEIGPWQVRSFDTQHDAAESLGYLIRYRPTGEMFVYATDTYYIPQCFPGVHFWLVECNYCTDTLNEQYANGEIDKSLYRRLLTSHMSLETLKAYFTKAPPEEARKIVLCHLSDARSDETRMVREISGLTGVDTVAAQDGLVVELEQYPF